MTARRAPHTPPSRRRVFSLPKTRLGWISAGLTALFLVYVLALIVGGGALQAEDLPEIGPFMFVVTMVAAVAGLLAVHRVGERSILMVFC